MWMLLKVFFSEEMHSLASYGTCLAEHILSRNHRRKEKEYTLVWDVKASEGPCLLPPVLQNVFLLPGDEIACLACLQHKHHEIHKAVLQVTMVGWCFI